MDVKEKKYIEFSSKHFDKNNIIIDVGAFIGEWTLEVMNIITNYKFFVFEPNIDNFKRLSEEFKTKSNVTLINCGLGEKCYKGKYFNLKNNDGVRKMSGFVKRDVYNNYDFDVIDIDIVNLDSIKFNNDIDFLKIDVEGFELDVLKGANILLSNKKINFIQFEYGGTFLDKKIKLNDIILYLKSFGYKTYNLKNNKLYEVLDFIDDYQYDNLLSTHIKII